MSSSQMSFIFANIKIWCVRLSVTVDYFGNNYSVNYLMINQAIRYVL